MTIEYWHFALSLIAVAVVFGGLGFLVGLACIQIEMDAMREKMERLIDQLAD